MLSPNQISSVDAGILAVQSAWGDTKNNPPVNRESLAAINDSVAKLQTLLASLTTPPAPPAPAVEKKPQVEEKQKSEADSKPKPRQNKTHHHKPHKGKKTH